MNNLTMEKKINDYFYISIGQGSIYYTLREICTEVGHVEKNEYGQVFEQYQENDYYRFNLSTDKNIAIKKANQIAKKENKPLAKPNGDLIVTGKIGDLAKEKEIKKTEKFNNEATPKLAGSESFSLGQELTEEEKIEKTRKEKAYQEELQKRNEEAELFYANPVWSKIRKELFSQVVGKIIARDVNNDKHNYWQDFHFEGGKNNLANRKRIRFHFINNNQLGFVYEMYKCILNKEIIYGKAVDIVFDIYAKKFSRKGSKDYNKVLDELYEKVAQ